MSERVESLTRREALATLGKATAAAAVIAAVNTEVFAQSSLSFLVATYRAYHQSAPQYSWETRIYVYNEGASQYAILNFMKDGQAIPANTIAANGLSGSVYFPATRMAEVRDLLRNEKRLRLTIATNGIVSLFNETYEPIGDADL